MIPNFIVIGAAKCGTTSICELIGQHPHAFMSDPKEPCFYSHMNEGGRTRDWYESLFTGAGDARAIGEGSTAYTHPDVIETVAQRIHSDIPDCRLIYMVRHPLRRLESDWRMRLHEDWTPASISAAAREQTSLVTHGLYWRNLNVYRSLFNDEQILIVFLEDFTRDPETELERCFRHIGVDPDVRIENASTPRNTSAGFRKDSALAARLRGIGGFEQIKERLPAWLVNAGKQALTRKERFAVEWDDATRAEVIARFAPDSALFLAHCGKPADFWSFAS